MPRLFGSATKPLLSNVPGFEYEYDVMEDRMRVLPTAPLREYIHQDGLLLPTIESYETELFFSVEFASASKIQESVTGAIFLVDDTRYFLEIPFEYQEVGTAYTDIGETGAEMIRAIVKSTNPVRVRLRYSSGNIDFDMSDYQIDAIGRLFAAYESIGGMKQPVIPSIDVIFPIIVK